MANDPRRRKQWEYMKSIGKPARCTPEECEQAARHLQWLSKEMGMADRQVSQVSGVPCSGISRVRAGFGVTRRNYDRIMAIRPELPDLRGSRQDPTGARRRIRALRAAGFPLEVLAKLIPASVSNLRKVCLDATTWIHWDVAQRIAQAYDKLRDADPSDYGVPSADIARAKTWAKGFAPSWCWDDDTIDDPDAAPEWTGACGTSEGYRIHLREGIPVCDACQSTYRVEQERTFSYEKFARAFIASGLSGQELAQMTGASTTAVYRWTRGERNPLPSSVNAIAQALGVGVEDITDEGDVVTISPPVAGEFNRHTLAVAIEQRGWNRNALGKAAGLSHTAISKWTTGAALPHKTSIQKVAEILGIDWKEFYR